MIKLFTIGFTNKSAQTFFDLLRRNNVSRIVDTRLNNVSQLAGFAKGADLAFFADAVGGMRYDHRLDLAPTKEMLTEYRAGKMTWAAYETAYLNLLDKRTISRKINVEDLHENCLLCSEHTPEKCHRRLLAEYLQATRNDISVTHLIK